MCLVERNRTSLINKIADGKTQNGSHANGLSALGGSSAVKEIFCLLCLWLGPDDRNPYYLSFSATTNTSAISRTMAGEHAIAVNISLETTLFGVFQVLGSVVS